MLLQPYPPHHLSRSHMANKASFGWLTEVLEANVALQRAAMIALPKS